MIVKIDYSHAQNVLLDAFEQIREKPRSSCSISQAIDTVFNGDKCLTYQYILFTALLAKTVDARVDVLSLQIEDESDGAYAPRSLCKEVVYPFQLDMLDDVMDGSNNDPLVNKPARFSRLTVNNQARGDGKKALYALCKSLPEVATQTEARQCLEYLLSKLFALAQKRKDEDSQIQSASLSCGPYELREFLSKLLDQGFGGDALVLVAGALYRIQYPEADGFEVIPHPVNQPGNSSRQFSDLDLKKDDKPYFGTELKDKPFTEQDVRRAADTVHAAGVRGLIFISGRDGSLSQQTRDYFLSARTDYAKKGVYIGLTDIDALMDSILVSHIDIDVPTVLRAVYSQARSNGSTPETIRWIHKELMAIAKKNSSQ